MAGIDFGADIPFIQLLGFELESWEAGEPTASRSPAAGPGAFVRLRRRDHSALAGTPRIALARGVPLPSLLCFVFAAGIAIALAGRSELRVSPRPVLLTSSATAMLRSHRSWPMRRIALPAIRESNASRVHANRSTSAASSRPWRTVAKSGCAAARA